MATEKSISRRLTLSRVENVPSLSASGRQALNASLALFVSNTRRQSLDIPQCQIASQLTSGCH